MNELALTIPPQAKVVLRNPTRKTPKQIVLSNLTTDDLLDFRFAIDTAILQLTVPR